jgi:hypothetical protein
MGIAVPVWRLPRTSAVGHRSARLRPRRLQVVDEFVVSAPVFSVGIVRSCEARSLPRDPYIATVTPNLSIGDAIGHQNPPRLSARADPEIAAYHDQVCLDSHSGHNKAADALARSSRQLTICEQRSECSARPERP